MAFELNTLALEPTTEVQLKNPVTGDLLFSDALDAEGNPLKVSVLLYGKASKQYRAAETTLLNRALRRQAKKDKPDAEQVRADGLDMIVACIAGFKELAYNGVVPSTPEQYRALLSDPALGWVRAQIDEALGDDANFLAK